MNAEGYRDETAEKAIKHSTRVYISNPEKERVSAVVGAVRTVLWLAGFELVGRITIKDHKTGKIYK